MASVIELITTEAAEKTTGLILTGYAPQSRAVQIQLSDGNDFDLGKLFFQIRQEFFGVTNNDDARAIGVEAGGRKILHVPGLNGLDIADESVQVIQR